MGKAKSMFPVGRCINCGSDVYLHTDVLGEKPESWYEECIKCGMRSNKVVSYTGEIKSSELFSICLQNKEEIEMKKNSTIVTGISKHPDGYPMYSGNFCGELYPANTEVSVGTDGLEYKHSHSFFCIKIEENSDIEFKLEDNKLICVIDGSWGRESLIEAMEFIIDVWKKQEKGELNA